MDNRINTLIKSTALVTLGVALSFSLVGCSKKEVPSTSQYLKNPEGNVQVVEADFDFPSRPPKLSVGRQVFMTNCAVCHASNFRNNYAAFKDVRPIDSYLTITEGTNGHKSFRQLSRDDRWAAIFFARYIAGGAKFENHEQLAALFGSNCAVCHGTQGKGDGPLFTGHATAHEMGMAPIKHAFHPPPANFHDYARLYNRSDDQLVKFISEGIYPSAMPPWLGREDKDKGVKFDENTIRQLVFHVRTFAYEDDLSDADKTAVEKELSQGPQQAKASGSTDEAKNIR